jgi:hypothetical protein
LRGGLQRARPRERHPVFGQDPPRPPAHHQDPVAEHDRFVDIVGDVDRRLALVGPAVQQLGLQDQPHLRVERAERLVHQEDGGVGEERAAERGPLAHAAGKFMRIIAGEGFQPRALQPPSGRPPALGGRNPLGLEAVRDVVEDRHPGEQAVVLEHHCAARRTFRSRPLEADRPRGGGLDPGDELQQGGLPAAAGSHDAEELV